MLLLLATGTATPTSQDFALRALGLPPGEFVLFLTSATSGNLPGVGGSQGTLCLGSPLGRFAAPGQLTTAGAAGTADLTIDPTNLPLAGGTPIAPGETWHFQAWYRDANPQPTSNLTDAVAVRFL